uniref:Transmembrane protein 256 homolog n=1 Tax=Caenorhabditis japonica TaxID=281687 RepID=A0A8R1EAD6_CAEJA
MTQVLTDAVNTVTDCLPIVCKRLWSLYPSPSSPPVIVAPVADMSPLIRLAGLSGAVAISLGAYGSHALRDDPKIEERRRTAFDTASRYHLIHSLALLATPSARFPLVTAGLFSTGIVLFCGPCYHYSITGSEITRKYTPIGGLTLIVAWLSFIL